jgi:peptidylprolyl isomerase
MRSRQLLLLLALILGACGAPGSQSQTPTQSTVATQAVASSNWTEPTQSACLGVKAPATNPQITAKQWPAPENVIDPTHTYCAILTTNRGQIIVELYPQAAPKNVNSFVFLAQQGYYDNLTWHRVIPGFVAQTGDPQGTGMGGPGYTSPLEVIPQLTFDRPGRVGVARSQDPNSGGSQFFIAYTPQPGLNPHSQQMPDSLGYTIIGQVVEGMDVVRQITPFEADKNTDPNRKGDPLVSIRVVDITSK